MEPLLVCHTIAQPSASLIAAGRQRLIPIPGPPIGDMLPDLSRWIGAEPWYGPILNAGQRLGIMSTSAVPFKHPWNEYMPKPTEADLAEGEYPGLASALRADAIMPLERIVGSVTVDCVASVVDLQGEATISDPGDWYGHPVFDIDTTALWKPSDKSQEVARFEDQSPFVKRLKVGDWVMVVTEAAKTNERCPMCNGKGGTGWCGDAHSGGPWSPCPWCWPRDDHGEAILGVSFDEYEQFVGTCPPINPFALVTDPLHPSVSDRWVGPAKVHGGSLWTIPEWRNT